MNWHNLAVFIVNFEQIKCINPILANVPIF